MPRDRAFDLWLLGLWWFVGDEVALFAPVEEWCGEAGVIAATVVESDGGVDDFGVGDLVAGGPVVPGGERVEGAGRCLEPGVGCLQVSPVGGLFDSKAVAFGGELVSLIEDRSGPFDGLVEGGLLFGDRVCRRVRGGGVRSGGGGVRLG